MHIMHNIPPHVGVIALDEIMYNQLKYCLLSDVAAC